MSICVPQAANQATLHFEPCDVKRCIYMIRSRVDYQGNLHEENRTTFHRPEWMKLTDRKWIQKRDHFLSKTHDIAKESGIGIKELK